MSGFTTFQEELAAPMKVLLKRYLHRASPVSGSFDVEVPLITSVKPNLTPEEQFVSDAFQGFMEISETYERLLDIELYVRRFPFSRTRITRVRYLRFHVEAYLHESYILRERLLTFAKRVTRAYKKSGQAEAAKAVVNHLAEIVASLDDVTVFEVVMFTSCASTRRACGIWNPWNSSNEALTRRSGRRRSGPNIPEFGNTG